jgi:predicted PurR-regulated permease PerM
MKPLKIEHELAKSVAILLAFAVGGWWLGGLLGAILAIIAVPVLLFVLILLAVWRSFGRQRNSSSPTC